MTEKIQNGETLHVLVHPHFLLGIKDSAATPFKRKEGELGNLRASTALLFERSGGYFEHSKPDIVLWEIMHRFYRREIERVAKQKNARLVIVKSQELCWPYSNKKPRTLEHYLSIFQDRLAEFAKRKLGKKAIVTHALEDLGEELKPKFASDVSTTVFGEYSGLCVAEAAKSLTKHGFTNVRIDPSKSTLRKIRGRQLHEH